MAQSDFRALLHRYQRNECTPVEKQRVEEWYQRLGSKQELDLTPEERAELVATVWQRIATLTTAASPSVSFPKAKVTRPLWPSLGVRWAAVVLLALGAGVVGMLSVPGPTKLLTIWQPKTKPTTTKTAWLVYANTSKSEARVALPDGSLITLAAASSLKYPRSFTGPRRTVYLTGAAFFDVFHDAGHPFSVYTDQVVTTVLGTSFRVQAYPGQPEVQVQVRTGRVRVSPRATATGAPAASVVVLPNQQAVYSAVRQELRRELVAQPVLLAPQPFVFNDRPVAEVLDALQKAYGVAIVYDAAALHNCTINLSLGDEPLFEKLDIISETLGASYDKADGRILFHSQPCRAE
ncbi:FecR family protein [Hymenobacter sedentarius]|uniref:FecR family protein n=1 Tax=Hymenobacter sedentarius TaxID=1411621 RepID=UPI0009E6DEEC|nr:FecR family protein [Hymenobacter sedentarius]